MRRKVLITGSNGFIGQKLMLEILENGGFDLIAVSKGKNRFAITEGYLYVAGDVCNSVQMSDVISKHQPHFIIHTVAMANVEACEEDIDACRRINIDPIKTLISLADRYNSHLIQLSTDFVFDGEEGPYSENAVPHPLNEYGRSKLEAERLIQASTIKWAIVRTILVYGIPNDRNRSNIILWVKNSLEAGKKIDVTTDHYRMPTLVEDLAKATISIMDVEGRGIYHVSGSELFSIYDIAQKVADFWNLDSSLILPVHSSFIKSTVARPSVTGFFLEKARKDLGFQPRSLQEGLTLLNSQLIRDAD